MTDPPGTPYQVELSPAAERTLRKLDKPTARRLVIAISALGRQPRPPASSPRTSPADGTEGGQFGLRIAPKLSRVIGSRKWRWRWSWKRKVSRQQVLTAILSAVLGGVIAIWVEQDQVAAAQQQSQQSFLREQRVQAYLALTNADVELQGYELDCVDEISKEQGIDTWVPPSTADILKIHDNIRAAHRKLPPATAKINTTVGVPPEIIQLARELVNREAITVNSMLAQNAATYGQQSSDLKTVRDNIHRGFAAFQAFTQAVAKDLAAK